MKTTQRSALSLIAVMLLASCGGGGGSDSGAIAQPTPAPVQPAPAPNPTPNPTPAPTPGTPAPTPGTPAPTPTPTPGTPDPTPAPTPGTPAPTPTPGTPAPTPTPTPTPGTPLPSNPGGPTPVPTDPAPTNPPPVTPPPVTPPPVTPPVTPPPTTPPTTPGTGSGFAEAKTPNRTGGNVHMLISNWTGKGFQLLTTAPQDSVSAPLTSIHTKSAHAGSVWDSRRNTMWIFGAETHNINMDNAVYGWRASDGLFVKHYDGDPASGYMMDANGVYWSSAAKDKPWGMHTYRRMRMVPGTDEFEVIYDPYEHAGMSPKVYENPAMTVADRKPVIWYYNVVTGKWRYASFMQSASFVSVTYTYPTAYDPTYGWFGGDGSFWTNLSNNGNYSKVNISGKSNGQYHSYLHTRDGVAYRVGGNANTTLYSRHPLSNITLSTKHLVADFPALAGYTVTNMASAMMPNGKIVIFPTRGSETHAMILDPEANTVSPTGHFFTGMDKPTLYELAAEWDTAHEAVILLSRRFTGSKVFGYRP